MKLYTAYSEVIKYGILPHEDIKPFLEDKNNSYTAIRALIDKLEESDDPRADIIKRNLGLTTHPHFEHNVDGQGAYRPEAYLPSNAIRFGEPSKLDEFYIPIEGKLTDSGYPPYNMNKAYSHISIAPVHKDFPSSVASDVYMSSSINHPTIGEFNYSGIFTPEEARDIADKLPDPHRDRVHAMLDRHFGKRT